MLGDYVHLFRDNPVVQPLIGPLMGAWRNADVRPARPMRSADTETLVAMVRHHEGDAEAEIAARWFTLLPEATEVFDDADGQPAGFLMSLPLNAAEARDRDADPSQKRHGRPSRARAGRASACSCSGSGWTPSTTRASRLCRA